MANIRELTASPFPCLFRSSLFLNQSSSKLTMKYQNISNQVHVHLACQSSCICFLRDANAFPWYFQKVLARVVQFQRDEQALQSLSLSWPLLASTRPRSIFLRGWVKLPMKLHEITIWLGKLQGTRVLTQKQFQYSTPVEFKQDHQIEREKTHHAPPVDGTTKIPWRAVYRFDWEKKRGKPWNTLKSPWVFWPKFSVKHCKKAGLPGTPQIRESISKLFVPKVNHRFNKRPTSEAEWRQHDVLIVVIVGN